MFRLVLISLLISIFFSVIIEAKLSDLQINIISCVVNYIYVLYENVYLGGFPSLCSIDKYFKITQIAIFINE